MKSKKNQIEFVFKKSEDRITISLAAQILGLAFLITAPIYPNVTSVAVYPAEEEDCILIKRSAH